MYVTDTDLPIVDYFDNIAYDITYEERSIYNGSRGDEDVLAAVKWVWVARLADDGVGTRYKKTEAVSRIALGQFYKETKK